MPSYFQGWLTSDGRARPRTLGREPGGDEPAGYVVSADGQGWAVAEPPGLPAVSSMWTVKMLAYNDRAMYVSDDGWTWREVWHD